MNPSDPNEPLPTTPVTPEPRAPEPLPPAPGAPPPGEPTRWGAPPPQQPWGPPPGWGAAPPQWPAQPPPRRDRLAIGVVAFVFGGLFLVFFGFLLLAYSAVKGEGPTIATGPKVGVVEVKGAIGSDDRGGADSDEIVKAVRRFAEDDGILAVIVRIDSPGGAAGPSQEIYDEVKKLSAKKPTVCSMGNLAASGGFYVAMGCRKIVAAPSTLTGSIGVVSQFPNLRGLAERFDIRMETVKSGKLKDAGNPFRDMTPEDRVYWQGLIDRVYAQFVRAVVESRKLPEADVRAVADGRVVTGEEAKERGLVDALGNFYAAVDLVKAEAGLSGEPHLVYPPDERGRFLEQLMGGAASALVKGVRDGVAHEAAASQEPGLYFLAR
jgi:protease IV